MSTMPKQKKKPLPEGSIVPDIPKRKSYIETDSNGHLVEYEDFPGRIEPPANPKSSLDIQRDDARKAARDSMLRTQQIRKENEANYEKIKERINKLKGNR